MATVDDKKIIFSMVGVSKIIPQNQKQILKNIYLSFFYGAKIGIIGLNGAGKSTLMKIIAGLVEPTQGEVVWSPGYSVGYLPQDARRGGQVTDARRDAGVGEDRQALLENPHVARGRGIARLAGVIGAGHVAPRAHDVDEAIVCGHAQGRGQGGQVGERGAGPGHAGIDLDVNAGGAAHRSRGGADVGEDPGPRHGQVDVGLDRGREVGG